LLVHILLSNTVPKVNSTHKIGSALFKENSPKFQVFDIEQ